MMNKVNDLIIMTKLRGMAKVESLMKEEKGASDIVAIIVVIIVILAVAAIFQEQLTSAVTSVFQKLTDFIGE